MLVKIVIVAGVIVLALFASKNDWLLRRTDLMSSCRVYTTDADGYRWETCHSGEFDGRPNLSVHGCTSQGDRGPIEYWACPPAATSSGPM
jgi:hypothetical protein